MDDIKAYLAQFDPQALKRLVESNKKKVLPVVLNGNKIELKQGVHFYLNMKDKQA